MKENKLVLNKNVIILILFIVSFIIYIWTINLPIIGDGLMHMNDNTDLSVKNIFKSLFTFDGLNKPDNSYTLSFHRPVFNEIIIEILKKTFDYNVVVIRTVTVLAFSLTSVVVYLLGREIFCNDFKAIALAIMMIFSIVRFPGVYEVGLSFSVWLVLFETSGLYYTVKYQKSGRIIDFILAIVFTALSLYTKESAMTLGVAFSLYFVVKEFVKNKKINKKMIFYSISQFFLLSIYLLTRIYKLDGKLFEVTGGGINSEKIIIKDCIDKIKGFFLLAFNIPNDVCFEIYMCPLLTGVSVILISVIILALLFAFHRFVSYAEDKNIVVIDVIVYILCFIILIIPVFKTTRNSTYYGDILVIFTSLILVTLLGNGKITKFLFGGVLLCYISIFCINVYDCIKPDSFYYLKCMSNESKLLRDILVKEEIDTDKVYFTTNWINNNDRLFMYNHMGEGSFYRFNVDNSKKTDVITSSTISDIDNSTLIDFYQSSNNGTYKCFFYSIEEDRGNQVIQIKYDSSNNDSVSVGFFYEDTYYYSNFYIDNGVLLTGENYIYMVVPQGVDIDVQANGTEKSVIYN